MGSALDEVERAPAGTAVHESQQVNLDRRQVCGNLYRAICRKTGVTRDPTGVVKSDLEGEIEALRLYEGLIREHPDWNSEQIDDALVSSIFTPKRRARMESAFKWVLHTILQVIHQEPAFSSSEKKAIRQRLKKTQLQLPPPAALYEDEPDLFTKNDVFYERTVGGEMRLRVGGAFLFSSKSWFNLIFTFAHELAHSIDPCEIRSVQLSFPAYDRLSACFAQSGWIAMRRDRRECEVNDQLSETFADYIAVKVVAIALRTFATEFRGPQLMGAVINSVRDLCEQDQSLDEVDTTDHPSPEIRIERLFGENPDIRAVLGCGPVPVSASKPEYCGFDWNFVRKTR